ncbi:MAG TPA: SDR family oxidoreductase [Acidimicrobiales bacterium]|nr:SDR family oxidoreductase [Acidimicrobiales bacterium]
MIERRGAERGLAVVVGAGGMGMAVARRLGQRHRLLLADKDEEVLLARTAQLEYEGHDVVSCVCDVTRTETVAGLAEVTQVQGPLAVLAHVVGLSPSMGTFGEIVAVDLVGAILVEQALRPLATAGTAALFVSSIAGHGEVDPRLLRLAEETPIPGVVGALARQLAAAATSEFGYVLAKAGVVRLCQRRAADWGQRGARIVSISPGLISTPMGALESERQPLKRGLLAGTPLRREGTVLEIADVVEFLTSDRASFISGIDIVIDGGLLAAQRFPLAASLVPRNRSDEVKPIDWSEGRMVGGGTFPWTS